MKNIRSKHVANYFSNPFNSVVLPTMIAPSLNPEKDAPLFKSPRYIKDIDAPADRGTDLFVHMAYDGSVYYYLYHWSVYPNEMNICQITSADSARDFILEHVGWIERQILIS